MGLRTQKISNLEQELVPNAGQAGQTITVDATSGGKQIAALHRSTTHVMISIDAQPVRVTFSGTAPTDTTGIYLPAGTRTIWSKALALAAKFIRATGTSGTLAVEQLREP